MATGDGVNAIKNNLAAIAKDPSSILKKAAEAVLDDIITERIDGEKTIEGGPMPKNAEATIRAKRRKGRSPADHSLWDSQTLRKKTSWDIRKVKKTLVYLEPKGIVAKRSLHVQRLGYDFFGVSKEGSKAADEAMEKQLRKELEKNVPGLTKG